MDSTNLLVTVSVTLTREQRDALHEHGAGNLSRGLRAVIAEYLGVGPSDLPRGLAAAAPDVRQAVTAAGLHARWHSEILANQVSKEDDSPDDHQPDQPQP